jgi:DNA-binding CsgD family transcriptional regulator/tetratricopeptide (TPR) repeat protein
MLETIRELGLERLAEAREDAAVRARHAAWVRRLVEALDLFRTMQGDLAAMRCLAPEQDNLRQALAWFAARGDRLALNYLSAALSIFWCSYGQYAEARRWLQLAIADDRDVPALTRAQAWNEAGWLAMVQGELDLAQSLREHGLTLAREAGDPFRIGGALLGSGILAFWLGDLPRATAMLEEAERTFLAIADEVAAAPVKAGSAETVLACIALMTGDVPRAVARFEEAMWRTRTSGAAADQSYVVCGLGYARLQQGALPAAAACFLEATALSWSIGDDAFLARIFWATAAVAAGSGLAKSGAHLAGVADALDARTGSAMWPNDRVVAEGCLASLESALGPAAVSDLRRAGASLSVAQGVALARTVAERVLGAACVTATWQATGAPAPEVTDGDVAFDRLAPADPASGEPGDLLSKREREVLSLLCQRLTDREIADRLYLSPRTVEHHVASILAKLDVASRRDAAALAARLGLL